MNEPIPVQGLFETHLAVSDLDRSIAFYRDVVGLPLALNMPERGAAFLWIGEAGGAMLGLWTIGSAPIGLTLHVAFTTSLPLKDSPSTTTLSGMMSTVTVTSQSAPEQLFGSAPTML